MTEYRDVLERVGDRAPMPEPAFDRILRRRDRKRRNQRISAGVIGLTVSVALVLALANVSADRGARPIVGPPPLPTNGWIAYAAEPGNEAAGSNAPRYIYLSRDGEAARRIVGSDGDGLVRRCPVFSPDGSKLAYSEYSSYDASPTGPVTLVVTALDGTGDPTGAEQRIAAPTMLEPYLFCAEWSPDGRRLAYEDDTGLWVASLDGQTPVRLFDSRGSDPVHDFEWSPDGSQIAVSLLNGGILLVPVDGKDVSVVPGGMNGGTLTWAPDGTRVAVGRDGSWGARNPGIQVIDVDRNVVRTLDLGDDPKMGGDPAWSPDGEHIAFVEDDRIVLADPDGGGSMTLPSVELPDISKRPLSIWAIQWSPDGQRLLSIGAVLKPDVTYAVVSFSVDGTSSAVAVSPVTFGLYFTTPSDLDWQAVPP
ncbi:MAG: WD40 repeat domain-containing protein [Actinomycetota bacterium]